MTSRSRSRPLLLCLALAGCGSGARHTADYLAPGTFGVGISTFTFVDTTRPTPANGTFAGAPTRTLTVDVWYPSSTPGGPNTDAPPAAGRHPLVVHGHGFMDNRHGESYLGEHLASWGFVVASPDFPLSSGGAPGGATIADTAQQPLDVRFVIDQLLAQPAVPADGARIGVSGLSLGALTALLSGYHPRLRDGRVRAVLSLAAPSCMLLPAFFASAPVPLLLAHGDADLIVPPAESSVRAYDRAQPPKELVLLARGSHTAFTGFASLLDETKNYDRIGCQALGATPIDVTTFASLGTEADGISSDVSACPKPCQAAPIDPSLNADRQLDLTRALALAFFSAELENDAAARAFVRATVTENPEVTVRVP